MFRYLLNFWLLPIFGMFFAAGATIADLGAGAGDGGGDSQGGGANDADNGGDDGDDRGGSGGADDIGTGDDADLGADADGQGDDQADPNAPVDLGDGRTVPAKISKLFKLAKTAGVEKEVKQLYFAQQRLTKVIPGGVNGAIQLAKSIEEMGGVEGIQQIQDDLGAYQADSELFTSSPEKWAEQGFQENPESALKAFVRSLDYVGEHHPEHYNHLMAKVIVNDLNERSNIGGIYKFLTELKDAQGNPNAQAKQLAKELSDYYSQTKTLSGKVPEKKVDAVTKALSERESKVNEKEMNLRYTEVNGQVFPKMKTQVFGTLQAEAKTLGLDLKKLEADYPGAFQGMLKDIQKQIQQAAIKDKRFVDKHYALVKKGDLKRAAEAVNQKHEAIVPDIVRAVAKASGLFKGSGKGKPNADGGARGDNGNAGANQNQGWTRVSKAPEKSAIDYSKTTTAMQIDGKYILKDGKKVVVHY